MVKIFDISIDGVKFHTIPYLNDEYAISKSALIVHKDPLVILNQYKRNGELYVEILGKEYLVSKLVLNTFIGPMSGKIQYKDGDKMNCSKNNLFYQLEIVPDGFDYYVNGILFKPAAHFENGRFYLSKDGVLLDMNRSGNDKLRHHTFTTREYLRFETPVGNDGMCRRMKHRWVYETFVGPISEGDEIDHLNGKHWDCNISNLEPVSSFENIQRSYDITHVKSRA